MKDNMSQGMLDLYLYKFKRYLGSVSREIQNRRTRTQKEHTEIMLRKIAKDYQKKRLNETMVDINVLPRKKVYTEDAVIELLDLIIDDFDECIDPGESLNKTFVDAVDSTRELAKDIVQMYKKKIVNHENISNRKEI